MFIGVTQSPVFILEGTIPERAQQRRRSAWVSNASGFQFVCFPWWCRWLPRPLPVDSPGEGSWKRTPGEKALPPLEDDSAQGRCQGHHLIINQREENKIHLFSYILSSCFKMIFFLWQDVCFLDLSVLSEGSEPMWCTRLDSHFIYFTF